MAGRKNFVSGSILTAADVNGFLMDQSVMVFDDDTARTAAIPTASEGMVTYLKDLNQVQAFDGSAFTPVGGILQVVQTVKTDTFSTSSATFVDVTGLSVSVTPSSTTSKIFVIANFLSSINGAGDIPLVNLVRGSTNIAQSTGSGLTDQTFAPFLASGSAGSTNAISFLDSPATTSATAYKIQMRVSSPSTAFVGRYAANDLFRSFSSITVMEVAG